HVLDRGIVSMALRVPVPAVTAYVASIVEIVQKSELFREKMMVGRDWSRKLHAVRIAIALRQITEYLIVGTIFLLDEDHVFDVVAQERHHRIRAAIPEAVVGIHQIG